jgi:hypothetical protein
VLGEAPFALLRENELLVGDHIELALRALDDRRVVLGVLCYLGRETRGPAVVTVSDGAVVDLDAHPRNATSWMNSRREPQFAIVTSVLSTRALPAASQTRMLIR